MGNQTKTGSFGDRASDVSPSLMLTNWITWDNHSSSMVPRIKG